MDYKDHELYQEEIRAELIKLNQTVAQLEEVTEKQLLSYEPPKDQIEVVGKIEVNTEKAVEVTNLEAIREYLGELSDNLTTAIEKSVREPVNELTIKNIDGARAETVKVSNLGELTKQFQQIIDSIKELPAPVVNVQKQTVDLPYSATKPLAVRLSDGKSFYNAIATAVAQGAGASQLKNVAGSFINPATEEKQDELIETVDSFAQRDVFNQLVMGTRNNQIEIDYSGTDPDTITLLTVTKTNGGDASNGGGQATYETGTNTSGEIKAITTRTVTYHPHAENYAAFTAIFTQGIANSFQRIGLYSDTNGFFIGYEGTQFGVTKRSNSVDTFINRNAFNVDKLTGQVGSKYTRDGTPEELNPHHDNLYRIRYGWLGAAPIYYEVLSPDGEWVTFHIIKHPNTVAVPTIEEPNQPLRVHIKKTTAGAANLSIKTACWAAGTSSDLQKLTSTVYDETLAKLTRSVITGKTTAGGGGYVNVKVDPSGALVTATTIDNGDPTVAYKLSDTDTGSDPKYYGYLKADGSWYIMKETVSAESFRYVAGTTGYSTSWTGRAGLTYNYFDAIF